MPVTKKKNLQISKKTTKGTTKADCGIIPHLQQLVIYFMIFLITIDLLLFFIDTKQFYSKNQTLERMLAKLPKSFTRYDISTTMVNVLFLLLSMGTRLQPECIQPLNPNFAYDYLLYFGIFINLILIWYPFTFKKKKAFLMVTRLYSIFINIFIFQTLLFFLLNYFYYK